jgi:hypothetical protein
MKGGNLEVLRHTDISALIATVKDAILGVDHDAPPNTHIYLTAPREFIEPGSLRTFYSG